MTTEKKMKKVKFLGVGLLLAAFVFGFSVQSQDGETDPLLLENVEALAGNEGGSPSDCEYYCVSDDTCTCIIKYHGGDNVEHRTCPDQRSKNY